MRVLRRAPRELYRVYTEDEFFDVGELQADLTGALRVQPRTLAAAVSPGRATVAALLAGILGTVAWLAIVAGLGHRRAVRRPAQGSGLVRWASVPSARAGAGGPRNRASGGRDRLLARHRGRDGTASRAAAAPQSRRREVPAPQRRQLATAAAAPGPPVQPVQRREPLRAFLAERGSTPRQVPAAASAHPVRADFTFERR